MQYTPLTQKELDMAVPVDLLSNDADEEEVNKPFFSPPPIGQCNPPPDDSDDEESTLSIYSDEDADGDYFVPPCGYIDD